MLSFSYVSTYKEQLRRAERKNRDELHKLMEGHAAAGILTAKTHWRDYCLKVPAWFRSLWNNYKEELAK